MRIDTTAPAGGSIAYTSGYFTSLSVGVTLATGTDGGSGIGTRVLQRQAAAPLADGTCPGFGSFADLASSPALSFTDTTVATNTCYAYRYVVTDLAGNAATYTSASIAKADSTAPTITAIVSKQSNGTAGNGKLENGDTLAVTASEALGAAPSATTVSETRAKSGHVLLTITGLTTSADTGSSGYLSGTGTKSQTCTGNSAVLSADRHTATVTVGTCTGSGTATSTGALILVPVSTLKDLAGNSATATFTTAATFKLF